MDPRVELTDDRLLIDGTAWFDIEADLPPGIDRSVEVDDDGVIRFTLHSPQARTGLATGTFAELSATWPLLAPRTDDLSAAGVRAFGYQVMEFSLPSVTGPDGSGLAPWPLRPSCAMPIVWAAPEGPALLVGPLNRFFDQTIAVPGDEHPRRGVGCGWHGDLDEIPAGYHSTMVVLGAPTVRAAIARYGALICDHHGTRPAQRPVDPAIVGVSYWTDNGAHYYYRAEQGLDYPETIAAAVERIEANGVAIHAVQLDSWWYPHQQLRDLGELATVVPPTGARRWEPREDALPGGFDRLQQLLGHRPLVLHSRHLMADSPYLEDGFAGQGDPALAEVWMEQAAQWGACTYEQDWLIEIYLAFGELRRRAGAAEKWQHALDDAAARRGLTMQWCMPAPADLLHTARLSRVSSVRTSMDFRYLADRQANWGWFLHLNALARALGLGTSKDVFVTTGDDFATVESMLAAMSCGPVGVGDAIGATDTGLLLRTCRADGIVVGPDVPIAAWNPSFLTGPMASEGTLVGECWTAHPAGRWHSVMAMTAGDPEPVRFPTSELDDPVAVPRVAHQWSTGAVVPFEEALTLTPDPDSGADLWTVAPVIGGITVFGDVSRYVAAGRRRVDQIRIGDDGGWSALVYGSPGEEVTLTGWSATDGRWERTVAIGAHGWTRASG
jgi:hypothetical protein